MNKVKFLTPFFILLSIATANISILANPQTSLASVLSETQSQKLPNSKLQPKVFQGLLNKGDIKAAIKHIELGWKNQYEEYAGKRLPSNSTIDIQEIQNILKRIYMGARLRQENGKNAALLYTVSTPNHVELILITPNKPPIHKRIPSANKQAVTQVFRKFTRSVTNRYSEAQEYQQLGKQLYDWLFAPIEAEIKAQNIDHIIYCFGGGLRSLPIAAMYDGKQFLVEKYSLGIIPAFNLLDYQPKNINQTQILAMGASQFNNQAPLPAVPVELSRITSNPWQGTSLLNQEFTLANLQKQRSKYPYGIVHLATHAEFYPGSIEKSYIQFWDTQVKFNQIKQLGLNRPPVELLVLSACQTALGDPQAELGFAGLAVQSGAKAAIASLWSVDDAGTLALMTRFYRQLKSTPIKAEALRQTQIAMINQQVSLKTNPVNRGEPALPSEVSSLGSLALSHPFYWAGFTLIGNPW